MSFWGMQILQMHGYFDSTYVLRFLLIHAHTSERSCWYVMQRIIISGLHTIIIIFLIPDNLSSLQRPGMLSPEADLKPAIQL